MTPDAGHTPMDDLPRLAVLEPDRARAARTRRRCHAVLERQRRGRGRTRVAAPGVGASARVGSAVLVAFGLIFVAYVGELVATALRLLTSR